MKPLPLHLSRITLSVTASCLELIILWVECVDWVECDVWVECVEWMPLLECWMPSLNSLCWSNNAFEMFSLNPWDPTNPYSLFRTLLLFSRLVVAAALRAIITFLNVVCCCCSPLYSPRNRSSSRLKPAVNSSDPFKSLNSQLVQYIIFAYRVLQGDSRTILELLSGPYTK